MHFSGFSSIVSISYWKTSLNLCGTSWGTREPGSSCSHRSSSLFLKCKIYLSLQKVCGRLGGGPAGPLCVCETSLLQACLCVFAGAACAGSSSQCSHTNPNSLSFALRFCRGMVLPAVALTLVFCLLWSLLCWLLSSSACLTPPPVRGIQTQTLSWRIAWTGWSPGCPKTKVPLRTSQTTAVWRAPGQ